MSFSAIACRYLKSCKIEISPFFVKQRMKSHPDYPSLVSFTDTLDELGLEYRAVQADAAFITEFSFPFLAHTPEAVSSYEIVTSMLYYEENKEKFLNRWNGVALMVRPLQKVTNTYHHAILKQERKKTASFKIAVCIGLLIIFSLHAAYFNIPFFVFSLLSIAGISVCSLILLHSLGQHNKITEKLCSTSKTQSCNLILQSKAAKLTQEINWGDVGLMYFISLLIFSTISLVAQNMGDALMLLLIPTILSVCLSILSVFYQWKIAKAWCRMCLMVAGIVLLQAIFPLVNFLENRPFIQGSIVATVLQFAFATSIACLWLFIKPLIKEKLEKKNTETALLKWKRDSAIFLSLLSKQSHADTVIPGNFSFVGPPDAPLQFTIISNPFCQPCATAHRQLEALYKRYPDLVNINVIFYVKTHDPEDRRNTAAEYILKAIATGEDSLNVLHHWFEVMDIEIFKATYSSANNNIPVSAVMNKYQQWLDANPIPHTPVIYFNGYLLPRQYSLEDMASFVVELSYNSTVTSKKEQHEKAFVNTGWE